MSQKAALEFVGQLAVNNDFRTGLDAALAGAPDQPQSLSRAVEFAAQHGYDITAEELAEFAVDSATDELADGQLSNVAGGVGVIGIFQSRLLRLRTANCAGMDCASAAC
jgi:predicted ribosomally synthesized peptide with nif11-like leader